MFFLTRSVFGLPFVFLFWIRKPFHWEAPSSMRNISVSHIKNSWSEAKITHYVPRVFLAFVAVIVTLVFGICWYAVPDITFYTFALIATICVLVDSVMLLGRIKHHQQIRKESGSTALVIQEAWRDTSLKGILERQEQEIKEWKEKFEPKKEAHGLHVISQG